MSSLLRAVNVLSVFWEPVPTLCFFSIYEAAPAPSSNYSPQSCLHGSDDTDKTSQPQLGHEPRAKMPRMSSMGADRSFKSLTALRFS